MFNYGRNGFNKDAILLAIPISLLLFLMGGPFWFIVTWIVTIIIIGKNEHFSTLHVSTLKTVLQQGNYKLRNQHLIPEQCKRRMTESEKKYIDAYLTAATNYKLLYKKPITIDAYRNIIGVLGSPKGNKYWFNYTDKYVEIYRLIEMPKGMSKFEAIEKGYPKKELLIKLM